MGDEHGSGQRDERDMLAASPTPRIANPTAQLWSRS